MRALCSRLALLVVLVANAFACSPARAPYEACENGDACQRESACQTVSVATPGVGGSLCSRACYAYTDCPASTNGLEPVCVRTTGDRGQCFESCGANFSCASGFTCTLDPLGNYCAPVSGTSALPPYARCETGTTCATGTSCEVANMMAPGGGAGSFCTAVCGGGRSCPAPGGDAGLPTVCVINANATEGQCYQRCARSTDCPTRSTCSSTIGVCVPDA